MSRDALPAREDVIVRLLLERNAALAPDERFATFEDGATWTRAEALAAADGAAASLAAAGVGRGDRVLLFAGNGPGWLRAWWGSSSLGAVVIPVNTAFRGAMLDHVCRSSDATVIVADPALTGRLDEIDVDLARITPDELAAAGPAPAPLDPPLELWDTHSIMWTSGTTGPSKAVVVPYHHLFTTSRWLGVDLGLGPGDTWLLDLPLFHQAGLAAATAALASGCRIAVRSLPDLRNYWAVARDTGATMGFTVATMAAFLMAQPPGPGDRDHRLRHLVMSPLPPDPKGFVARFGLEGLITAYGSTEVSGPIMAPPHIPVRPGSAGVCRAGFELRIVDEHDVPVPDGAVGELIVRPDHPWMMSPEYFRAPEATARAWRNGWFHTGDAFWVDGDGYYFFHDRTTDRIRRRGENISTFEVEREVAAHPAVAEAACVAARDPLGVEDEVKVFVVPAGDASIDWPELLAWLAVRLPHFMVPRYFEAIPALPKTETMRVQKHRLREAGNTEATWDREVAGYHVTRAGLSGPDA
jgi:crotonobetaine/carnitine-CoA ligase